MGRSAVCKDSLLFRVVLCRAGSGDPNPLDENKLVLKQSPPAPSLTALPQFLVCLLSVDSKLLEGRLAPSRSPGPVPSSKRLCVQGRRAVTAPCSKPLGACCRPPPRPGLFLLPSRLPCIAHPSPSPTHTGLCVVPTRALHRQLPELCSPSPTCPRASQDGLRENSGNRRSPDSVAGWVRLCPGTSSFGDRG